MTANTPEPKPAPVPLHLQQFELVASRRGFIKANGKLEPHEGRYNDLTPQPENFRPLIGSYPAVAKEAARRNNAQIDHGFLDYLYAPERVGAKPIPEGPAAK